MKIKEETILEVCKQAISNGADKLKVYKIGG